MVRPTKRIITIDWFEKRLRGIAIREELTEEWKNREVRQKKKYAILTAEIAKAKGSWCRFCNN